MPTIARPPKHMLGKPNRRPYTVVDQRTLSTAVLMDSVSTTLVDGSRNAPLDQLLARPRRSKLEFEPDELFAMRSLGQMLRGEASSGGAPSARRKG